MLRGADTIIRDQLSKPDAPARTSPLAVGRAGRYRATKEIRLHEPWAITNFHTEEAGPAYRYEARSEYENSVVRLDYKLERLRDYIEVGEVAAHTKMLDTVRQDLGFSLTHSGGLEAELGNDEFAGLNPITSSVCGAVLLFSATGALWLWRRRRPPGVPPSRGIGGWLLLPTIGLCFSIVWLTNQLTESADVYFGESYWSAWTTPGGEDFNLALSRWVLAEGALNIALLSLAVTAAVFLFARRRETPVLMTGFYVMVLLLGLFDAISTSVLLGETETAESVGRLFRAILAAAIWIPYFHTSTRVRDVFTR